MEMAVRIYLAAFLVAVGLACTVFPVGAEEWKPSVANDSLPSVAELPNLFLFADGRQVESADSWELRRKEMKAILQYYQYGHLPPRPDLIKTENLKSGPITGCEGTEQRMTLVLGSEAQLHMRLAVYVPPQDESARDRRLPVIVREEAALGHIEEVPLLMKRGFMLVEYAREDLDPDKPDVVGPAQQAYPDYDWATLAVWAWGGMRVVDYLESREDVDLERIAILGHSRGGKMALLAGALDERFSLVVANGSGCGGAGCYRIQSEDSETLGMITDPERFAYWFHPRLRWFDGKEDRLPFDQHFLKGLVAPRALICTEAQEDHWANPLGTQATTRAAQKAFDFLDAGNKNAIHYRSGKHDLTQADWETILDFAEWTFFDKEPVNPELFGQVLNSASASIRRGMERFRANQIAESIQDFDRAAELEPAAAPQLWQRGISYYYAEKFADGRRQFESHQAVNPNDVENATWHFICVARIEGIEAARKVLLEIDTTRDSRVPMAEVYQLYAGNGSTEAVLKAANDAGTERAKMYAHLYLGLYYEVAGEDEKAHQHMQLSAAAKLRDNYMHDVAKIHLMLRKWSR